VDAARDPEDGDGGHDHDFKGRRRVPRAAAKALIGEEERERAEDVSNEY
jgi:hypothetical protein